MQKLKRFLKKIWEAFSLRFALFRIWFMKNILVILQVVLTTCLICILTGAIKSDTPVLGPTIYTFFAPLANEINDIIESRNIESVMSFFTVALTLLVSISVFTIKVRSIALSDIKNKKLKFAMHKANLYFNENGKLVKKMEKATGVDINGDGVIDDSEIIQSEGFLNGIKRAVSELITIATVEINGENQEEDIKNFKKAINNANLIDAAQAIDEIEDMLINDTEKIVNTAIGGQTPEVIETESSISMEHTNIVPFTTRVKRRVSDIFDKIRGKKVIKDEMIESIDNNDIDIIELNDMPSAELRNETKKITTTEVKLEQPKQPEVKKSNDATQNFLESLRKRVR